MTQGQFSDDVLGKMATTFVAFTNQADFAAVAPAAAPEQGAPEDQSAPEDASDGGPADFAPSVRTAVPGGRSLGGLVYNIQIQLPETRDPAVYDALFRSLRTHLLDE